MCYQLFDYGIYSMDSLHSGPNRNSVKQLLSVPPQTSTLGNVDHSHGEPFFKFHYKLEISLSDLFSPHAHLLTLPELAFAFTETSSQVEQRRNVRDHHPRVSQLWLLNRNHLAFQ